MDRMKEATWKLWILIPLCAAALICALLLKKYVDILIIAGLVLVAWGFDHLQKKK